MKIGIYIGSFNPIHKSHQEISKKLLQTKLDKVIYVPTGDKYNKPNLINQYHRLKMIKLILTKNEQVSDYEFNDHKYTYQTLRYYKEKYPNDTIYLIIGADNYNYINEWKNKEELLNYQIIVINRDNQKLSEINNNIILLDLEVGDNTSTKIREKLKQKQYNLLKDNLDNKVLKYIIDNNIYGA